MEITGRVQKGVVVFDTPNSLPEGAPVTVTLRTTPVIQVSTVRQRVEFPLVRSDRPGTLDLTNDGIAEALEAEEIEALRAQWNAPS